MSAKPHALPQDGWIRPAFVFDGADLHQGRAVRLAAGQVAEIAAAGTTPENAAATPEILAPGFVDLQVNGGGGVLFNTTPTAEGARAIAAAHRLGGSARILPTVITDEPGVLEAACDAVLATVGTGGIAGIHIEGPHINPKRRGTHRATCIRPYDAVTDRQITRLRDAGVPVLLTLAPECQPAGIVASLAERGVVVSLGHSAATYDETEAALAEGARAFTHLMNAMPPMENRNPGIVAAALNSEAWCGVIFDGVHVAKPMLQLIFNARRAKGRIFAVTDAMPTLFGPDRFTLYDGVEVRLEHGRLINPEGGLAGAHVSMLDSLRMLVDTLGVPVEDGLRHMITNPCAVMGLDPRLEGTPIDDCLLIAPDLASCRFGHC